MSLLAKIKGQDQPVVAAANNDLLEQIDPPRGAPIRAPSDRPSFKPVNPAVAEIIDLEDGQQIIQMKPVSFRPQDPAPPQRTAKRALENPSPPRDDFLDLIMDDPPPSAAAPSAGRPRVFANNAERQKAYRERQKAKRGL